MPINSLVDLQNVFYLLNGISLVHKRKKVLMHDAVSTDLENSIRYETKSQIRKVTS